MANDGYGAIRVSYSILAAWERGDIDRAVAPYAGVEIEPTQAMIDGKKYHERWERYTKRTKRLPKVFGNRKLNNPKLESETKKVVQLNDWCYLSGVLDVLDEKLGIDYKTGKSTATDYANGKQHNVYQILYPMLERFEYHCFNQHLHRKDPQRATMSVVYLNRETLETAIEWVLTLAAELREYLIKNGYENNLDQGKGLN